MTAPALVTRVKAPPVLTFYSTSSMVLPAFDAVAGNLIVVPIMFGYNNGQTITGVTDTAGNTYTRGNWQRDNHDDAWLELWYCLSSAAQTGNVVTVQCSRTFREAASGACQYSTPSGATWAYSATDSTPASGTTAAATYGDVSVPLVSPSFNTAGPGIVYLQGCFSTSYTADSGNTTGFSFSPDTTNGAMGATILGDGVRINASAQTGTTAQLAVGTSGTNGRTEFATHSFTYTGGGTNAAVGDSSLGALASAGTVGQTNPASGTLSLGALVCVGAVTLLSAAVGVSSLGALGSSGTVGQVNRAAGNSSLGALASTGTITPAGTQQAIGDSSLGALVSTGVIGQVNVLAGNVSLGGLSASGVIGQLNIATGLSQLGPLQCAGTLAALNPASGNSALPSFVCTGSIGLIYAGYPPDPRYFVRLAARPFYASLAARSFYAARQPRTFYILSDPNMTPTFDNKDPRETVVLTFDATADLDPGETLTGTPQIAISVLRGSDPGYATVVANPVINNSALSVGGASIATSHAVQAIATGGLGGCWYLVAITCTTSNMEKVLTMKGVLPVTAT